MTKLTRDQLYAYGKQAGFSGAALDEVVAIAFAESSGDTQHVNVNGASVTKIGGTTTNVPAGTKDRGILQINDWWNPSVSDACAFDPTCSFAWAYKMTGGKQPAPGADPFRAFWVTVQNGMYKKYLTPGYVPGSTSVPASSTGSSNSGLSGAVSGAVSGATGTTTNVPGEPIGSILAGGTSSATGTTTTGVDLAALQSSLQSVSSNVNTLTSSFGSAISQANNLKQATPSALIRIGLFALIVVVLIVAFGLVANSEEEVSK